MNFRTSFAVIALVALFVTMGTYACAAPSSELARIGLTAFGNTKQVTISSTCELRIIGAAGESIDSGSAKSATIDAAAKGFKLTVVNPSDVGGCLTISPADPEAVLSVCAPGRPDRKYRGTLEVTLTKGVLRLVNVVSVEDYLLGVLPAEMPDHYPQESLRAQAIAARTYFFANKNKNKHTSQGYDLCDSTDCQMYTGVQAEKPNCSAAVKDTCGQLLQFAGRPAAVFYSTDCGGVTRNYCETQPGLEAPYLCSVTEPEDIRHATWQKEYALSDLEKTLVAAGIKAAAGLKSIGVTKVDSAGWAVDISVTGQSETATFTAGQLRKILDASVIKSTCFAIEQLDEGSVCIKGKGSGHGWGMCQVGAKALAMPPHNLTHVEILAHYFPGTKIAGEVKPEAGVADVAMIAGDGNGPVLPAPGARASVETRPVDAPKAAEKPREIKLPRKAEKSQQAVLFDVRLQEP